MKNKIIKKKSKIIDLSRGKNSKIIEPVNIYGSKFGNDVFVGPFVEIQDNTVIGNHTKISSHCFICSLVEIGKNCFIGHGVSFINDKFKNGKTAKKSTGGIKNWQPTKIGNNVLIGSNSTILPVKICDDAVIGGGSVVTKDINVKGIYAGNPAKLIKKL